MRINEFHVEDRSIPFSTDRELWLWGRNHSNGTYMSAYFVDSVLTVEMLSAPPEGTRLEGGRPFLRYTGALHSHVLDVMAAIAEWHHEQTGDNPTETEVRALRERLRYVEDQLDEERAHQRNLVREITGEAMKRGST